tara:strand:- start:68 stop:304 length:237 start_codon:yes stop_codon:yes gene_type:complete
MSESPDMVNRPGHYTKDGGIECIDGIKASMSSAAFKGYLKGNVMKYIWRYENKNKLEDLQKANVYLGWLIKEVSHGSS